MKNEMVFNPKLDPTPDGELTRWMVVDDDESVGKLLASLLGCLGRVEVRCFHSAAQALESLAAAPRAFQFVVTDLEMPAMSGIEFCRRVKAQFPRLKILLATAGGMITS